MDLNYSAPSGQMAWLGLANAPRAGVMTQDYPLGWNVSRNLQIAPPEAEGTCHLVMKDGNEGWE